MATPSIALLVTGSRGIRDAAVVNRVLDRVASDLRPTLVIHGGADGVDTLAGAWAAHHDIPTIVVPPDVKQFGRSAYAIRDKAMVTQADHVVAIWDGTSPGTCITFTEARKQGKLHGIWNSAGVLHPQ
jgi:hypothetical protein